MDKACLSFVHYRKKYQAENWQIPKRHSWRRSRDKAPSRKRSQSWRKKWNCYDPFSEKKNILLLVSGITCTFCICFTGSTASLAMKSSAKDKGEADKFFEQTPKRPFLFEVLSVTGFYFLLYCINFLKEAKAGKGAHCFVVNFNHSVYLLVRLLRPSSSSQKEVYEKTRNWILFRCSFRLLQIFTPFPVLSMIVAMFYYGSDLFAT